MRRPTANMPPPPPFPHLALPSALPPFQRRALRLVVAVLVELEDRGLLSSSPPPVVIPDDISIPSRVRLGLPEGCVGGTAAAAAVIVIVVQRIGRPTVIMRVLERVRGLVLGPAEFHAVADIRGIR
jgi:hypothetical protein